MCRLELLGANAVTNKLSHEAVKPISILSVGRPVAARGKDNQTVHLRVALLGLQQQAMVAKHRFFQLVCCARQVACTGWLEAEVTFVEIRCDGVPYLCLRGECSVQACGRFSEQSSDVGDCRFRRAIQATRRRASSNDPQSLSGRMIIARNAGKGHRFTLDGKLGSPIRLKPRARSVGNLPVQYLAPV